MTSTPQELHEMSRVVGGLQNAVETMTTMWATQDAAATQGRRVLHDKLEAIREEMMAKVSTLTYRVDSMGVQINLIEPSVKAFNDETLRQEGAKRLGKWVIGGMTTVAGMVGWGVHEFVGYIFHK